MCGLEERQGTQRYSPIAYRVRPTRDCRRTARPVATSPPHVIGRAAVPRSTSTVQAAQLSGRKAGQASVASASCWRSDPYALGGEAAPAIWLLGAVSQLRLPMGRTLLCVGAGCRWDARFSACCEQQ